MPLGLPWRSESTRSSPGDTSPREQTSLALKSLLQSLETVPRPHVLDLGAVSGTNLEFFGAMGARLTVADLYRSLLPVRAELEHARNKDERFDSLLPTEPSSPFDVVLAWDILNYLKPEEIAWLSRSLARLSKPGTAILAFIASSGEMPLRPARYTIRDEETVLVEASAPRKRPAPRYSEPMLLRFMPSATVETRFQLRNEVVEYLFSLRGYR